MKPPPESQDVLLTPSSEDEPVVALPHLWDRQFRHMRTIKRMPNHKRGVMRMQQKFDPYVKEALKDFAPDMYYSIKGWTRVPGDENALFESLSKYDRPSYERPRFMSTDARFASAYRRALEKTRAEFRLEHKVTPLHPESVSLVSGTSSGFPHFKKKNEIEDQILKEGRIYHHLAKSLPRERLPLLPAAVGTRGALAPVEEPKSRLVWMYPAAITVAEAVYAQPIIEGMFNEKKHLFLTGPDSRSKFADFLSQVNGLKGYRGVGLDFSSFDTLPVKQLIYDAAESFAENIDFGVYYSEERGRIVPGVDNKRDPSRSKRRAEHAYWMLIDYFINTPILLPNGRVVRKGHGVPSGSHWTNMFDTWICRQLMNTMSEYTGIKFHGLKTNGDDSAFVISDTNAKGFLELASWFFDRYFRMTVKIEKSVVAESPGEFHASGTRWLRCQPHRSTEEWVLLALHPTTFVKDQNLAFQRMLGIGIAGGFADPFYCALFDHFQRGWDCRSGPNLLSWKKLRWLEQVFGVEELPKVYKQGMALEKIRVAITN